MHKIYNSTKISTGVWATRASVCDACTLSSFLHDYFSSHRRPFTYFLRSTAPSTTRLSSDNLLPTKLSGGFWRSRQHNHIGPRSSENNEEIARNEPKLRWLQALTTMNFHRSISL